ncbi:ribonuclease H-like domain-containing protein, partial [Tanacetum coccineum]
RIAIDGYSHLMKIAGCYNTEQPESTVNEYLTKVRDDSGPGIVRPLFEENIKFEFWGQCIDELKDDSVKRPGDAIGIPFYVEWKSQTMDKPIVSGIHYDLRPSKNAFLRRYRPLSQIIRQTNAIRNFGQECNEPLHLAWERFNNLLYNCPEHKINDHEQLQIFYQGLDPKTRQKVDFKGPIPRMTPAARIKAIDELSKHSFSWYKDEEYKKNDFDKVLKHINDFEHNISVLNEEVRMVQHQYKTPNDEGVSFLEETLNSFIKEAHWMQKKSENFVWRIKKNYDRTFKNQASLIKTIEKNLGRIVESIHRRGVGTLPSFTKTNLRGLAHAITTHSALNYQLPKNPIEDSNGLKNMTTEHIPTTENITPKQTLNTTKRTDPPIPFPIMIKKGQGERTVPKIPREPPTTSHQYPLYRSL